MLIFENGHLSADTWHILVDGTKPQEIGNVIISMTQWRENPEWLHKIRPIGLDVSPGTDWRPLLPELMTFDLIALEFSKYSDGRAYSIAVDLRKAGYRGILRAVGEVLFDQIQLMCRCGFDQCAIVEPTTLALLRQGRRSGLDLFYQPAYRHEATTRTRSWRRQSLSSTRF